MIRTLFPDPEFLQVAFRKDRHPESDPDPFLAKRDYPESHPDLFQADLYGVPEFLRVLWAVVFLA
jgi:hypothetical protein